MVETLALSAELGAEVVGLTADDLLTDEVIATCREALKWRGVLLLRGAHLDDDTQLAFSRKFGGEGGVAGGQN